MGEGGPTRLEEREEEKSGPYGPTKRSRYSKMRMLEDRRINVAAVNRSTGNRRVTLAVEISLFRKGVFTISPFDELSRADFFGPLLSAKFFSEINFQLVTFDVPDMELFC